MSSSPTSAVIVLSSILLSEMPAPLAIAGGALCIGGVIVARSRGRLPWRRGQVAAAGAD